ncbi:glycine oxidase ThiO [Pantanalinema sp. GBBB05]|uniref:glycine oxidase ThiO n=1 Tax=Pantanalinema sp. GBBB05 TaxID=2604139 RepID=UPI001DA37375|nr:glycine oxidase ThiO [Pantanalinema sp. GBBB05]
MSVSDVVIIGGGTMGLAIALELRWRGASVTVLSRNFAEAAFHAAAGMLAPQAEQLPPGPMLDLCLQSRAMYPDWTHKLEELTGLDAGYWACGILAPMYAEDRVSNGDTDTCSDETNGELAAEWLDRDAIHQHQPGLSPDVIGGWWYPQDAQVDNRLLATALRMAVQEAGVQLQEGVVVNQICRQGQQVIGMQTSQGLVQAGHYILATGAWSQELLPIPVQPRKGQMLSLRMNASDRQALSLSQVLFGSEIYIVPRRNGRVVLGATSEDVDFTPNNTPAGIQTLLGNATRLVPRLAQVAIEEFWWGFRPNTPDELPILGNSPYSNLTLATGHYRNGILLAPVTAEFIANLVMHHQIAAQLLPFHWSRFRTSRHSEAIWG